VLVPYLAEDMEAYKVRKRINLPANDDRSVLEPV